MSSGHLTREPQARQRRPVAGCPQSGQRITSPASGFAAGARRGAATASPHASQKRGVGSGSSVWQCGQSMRGPGC